MKRLANFDINRSVGTRLGEERAQYLFGALCALVMVALRSMLDLWAATAGPFALVYPTVLIATLYGHWRGGVAALVISFAWAWYFVLPAVNSFSFVSPTDSTRTAINAAVALVILVFAEAFRRAMQSAMAERDEEIARRTTLLAELEHRTKNNFALAASLLELQKRRERHPATQAALDQALARIHSFAVAYANLAETQGEGAAVEMKAYLEEIVRRVSHGVFPEEVEVTATIASGTLQREVAVAIGLFANEAMTNCAKYAFPDGRPGTVEVTFECGDGGWALTILDDGVGSAADCEQHDRAGSTGLGRRLLEAFARQANAEYLFETDENGCSARLVSRD